MSAVLIVNSAITLLRKIGGEMPLQRHLMIDCSRRSCSSRCRTVPSITMSPIWVTTPPDHRRIDDDLDLDLFAGRLAQAPRRGAGVWSSVRLTADRASATALFDERAIFSTSAPMIAGRSRARPVPTTIEIDATGSSVEALPFRRSSTICWRRVAGDVRVGQRVAQLVGALEDPGEPEQLVFDFVEATLGRGDARRGASA